MSYTVFESTNMSSTYRGGERIYDVVADTDIENGTFGYIEELDEGQEVIYKFVKGYKAGAILVVADNQAWNYDTSRITNQRRDKFVNEAGKAFTARAVKVQDEFGISADGFTKATQKTVKRDVFATIDETTGKLVATTTKPASGFYVKVQTTSLRGGELATPANNYGYVRTMYICKVKSLG